MQINTNYNTQNFNGRVNIFTLMKNQFSKAGRFANTEIAEIKASYPKARINQDNVGDTIELSFNHTDNFGMFNSKTCISPDGITETELNSERAIGRKKEFSLFHTIKKRFLKGSSDIEEKRTETQVIFNHKTKQAEEVATKTTDLFGPTEIKVTTKKNRTTTFPTTTIAGNIHPAQATKTVKENGDIVYIERHEHR